ncbi:LOW QUALITY PROTEIN: hypothetical protein TorRG33x02_188090, partial [Trema orientale]
LLHLLHLIKPCSSHLYIYTLICNFPYLFIYFNQLYPLGLAIIGNAYYPD